MGKKTCKECGETKRLSDFVKRSDAKDGRRGTCKDCERVRTKKARNSRCNRQRLLKSKYGITKPVYQAILRGQNNSCQICNINRDKLDKPLYVDHCHSTGVIRGLLCHACNIALGMFKDDIVLMERAIKYISSGKESYEKK